MSQIDKLFSTLGIHAPAHASNTRPASQQRRRRTPGARRLERRGVARVRAVPKLRVLAVAEAGAPARRERRACSLPAAHCTKRGAGAAPLAGASAARGRRERPLRRGARCAPAGARGTYASPRSSSTMRCALPTATVAARARAAAARRSRRLGGGAGGAAVAADAVVVDVREPNDVPHAHRARVSRARGLGPTALISSPASHARAAAARAPASTRVRARRSRRARA